MNKTALFAAGLLVCRLAWPQNGTQISGDWTASAPSIASVLTEPGLLFRFNTPPNNISRSLIPLNQIRRLTLDRSTAPAPAEFDVVREAGVLHLTGTLADQTGSGHFTFTPDPAFNSRMQALGFPSLTDRESFLLAVYDGGTAYVNELASLGVRIRSINQLISMKVQNVTFDYVRGFADLGYTDLSPDGLIGMRVQGVSPEFARELQRLGYPHPSPSQMIGMRVQGVSETFIREIQATGYPHPSIDSLIGMRVQGVTADYVRRIQARGSGNLSPDEIVGLKVQGLE